MNESYDVYRMQNVRTFITGLIPAALWLLLLSPSSGNSASMSNKKVQAELEDVLETLSNRQLTEAELIAVTANYISLFGDTSCGEPCLASIRANAESIAILKNNRGKPADIRIRHNYISALYFSPVQSGTLIQKIVTEPDPILVIEPSPQRLMTRADVIASMNLYHFANETDRPKPKTYSESEISEAAASMNKIYSSTSYVMQRQMPLAAAYWTGVQQGWATFSKEERQLVRAYFAADTIPEPLSAKLYASLLGLTPKQAQQFQTDEILVNFRRSMLDISLQSAITQMKMRMYSLFWAPSW